MRFATLGGQDAPDWLLACLVDLSRLSPAHFAELVQPALHGLLGQPLADGQLTRLADETALGANRVKAGLAALHHLLNSAAKYQVDTKTLSCELQQLGLPEEHGEAVCDVFASQREALQVHLRKTSLQRQCSNSLPLNAAAANLDYGRQNGEVEPPVEQTTGNEASNAASIALCLQPAPKDSSPLHFFTSPAQLRSLLDGSAPFKSQPKGLPKLTCRIALATKRKKGCTPSLDVPLRGAEEAPEVIIVQPDEHTKDVSGRRCAYEGSWAGTKNARTLTMTTATTRGEARWIVYLDGMVVPSASNSTLTCARSCSCSSGSTVDTLQSQGCTEASESMTRSPMILVLSPQDRGKEGP
eukprot:SM000256S08682  [mRNA]  locus=s256:80035:84067:+ [translate_table: standard]